MKAGGRIFSPDELDERPDGTVARLPFSVRRARRRPVRPPPPVVPLLHRDAKAQLSAQSSALSPVVTTCRSASWPGTGLVDGVAVRAARQMAGTISPVWPRLDASWRCLASVAALCVAAAFLATLPAALTWEGIPHALRSIGAWPFVVLFSGAVLADWWAARRWVPVVTVAVAVILQRRLLPGYFRFYRNVHPDVFHRDITEAIARRSRRSTAAHRR